jgi:Fanconi anemia group M protein
LDLQDKKIGENPLIRPSRAERRLYQESIAEKACLRNTLVVLPTALGKTVITALVAAHFLNNYRQARVLMMAPTRPLVLQHRESFLEILKIPEDEAIVLTGKTTNTSREAVWRGKVKLVFATPQVVRNDLMHEYVDLREFSLLVFDECHRATRDYAYTYVAKKYMERSPWPIILGTTASPGADRERVEEVCRSLFIEQIEYRSEEDADVMPYINPVQVEWRYVDLPEEYRVLAEGLRGLLRDRLSWLRRMSHLNKNIDYATRKDLLEIGEALRSKIQRSTNSEKGPLYSAIVAQSSALTLFHALELLETQGASTLASFLDKIESAENTKRSYRTIINSPKYLEFKNNFDSFRDIAHPKVRLLVEEIKEQNQRNPSSRVMVFTQYRDTATNLVEYLEKKLKIKVERFVGQASKNGDVGLSQDEQSLILKDFESGETKILVATCVAEEGLDIPSVDLVIFYEPVPSEIRHIQRRGRTGRKTSGRAVILAAKDTFDIAYLYSSKRKVEKMRKTAHLLNRELKMLIRPGPKPEPTPLSAEELQELEKESRARQGDEIRISEKDEERDFLSEVERASRKLLIEIMRVGGEGASIELLVKSLAQEEISPNAVNAAINKLENSGQIMRLGWDRVASVSTVSIHRRSKETDKEDLFRVAVEKVYPGRVVAWINDKWRARILPEDFEGPPQLLKKDSRFTARGSLYREDGVLCFRVIKIVDLR